MHLTPFPQCINTLLLVYCELGCFTEEEGGCSPLYKVTDDVPILTAAECCLNGNGYWYQNSDQADCMRCEGETLHEYTESRKVNQSSDSYC